MAKIKCVSVNQDATEQQAEFVGVLDDFGTRVDVKLYDRNPLARAEWEEGREYEVDLKLAPLPTEAEVAAKEAAERLAMGQADVVDLAATREAKTRPDLGPVTGSGTPSDPATPDASDAPNL